MTDELINALGRVPGLRVAARTSTFAFKGKGADIKKIAARLNVQTLLEGTVRRAGERLRITAQLVNAGDGCNLWSESYDRTLADVFAVQEELARAITVTLTHRVVGSASDPLVKPPTDVLEAYTEYLRWPLLRQSANGRGVPHVARALCRRHRARHDIRAGPRRPLVLVCHAWPRHLRRDARHRGGCTVKAGGPARPRAQPKPCRGPRVARRGGLSV